MSAAKGHAAADADATAWAARAPDVPTEWFVRPSTLHGVGHTQRVHIHAQRLTGELGWAEPDAQLAASQKQEGSAFILKAANHNLPKAHASLAQMYLDGVGVVRDPIEAGKWALIYRANGTVEELRSKAAVDLAKGDIVEMFVGGGAGFGRIAERPDAMIDRDLADGLLTRDPRSARKLAAE